MGRWGNFRKITNLKFQIPNNFKKPSFRVQIVCFDIWTLGIGIYMGFGSWDFRGMSTLSTV
jgi:hypothetical protein